jgi:hypothetical protein
VTFVARSLHGRTPRRRIKAVLSVGIATALVVVGLVVGASAASAAQATVDLGTAGSFAVLAGSTVTNTGPTVITDGDLGVSPGTSVTGFPPGDVPDGTIYTAGAVPAQAQNRSHHRLPRRGGRTLNEQRHGYGSRWHDVGGRRLHGVQFDGAQRNAHPYWVRQLGVHFPGGQHARHRILRARHRLC